MKYFLGSKRRAGCTLAVMVLFLGSGACYAATKVPPRKPVKPAKKLRTMPPVVAKPTQAVTRPSLLTTSTTSSLIGAKPSTPTKKAGGVGSFSTAKKPAVVTSPQIGSLASVTTGTKPATTTAPSFGATKVPPSSGAAGKSATSPWSKLKGAFSFGSAPKSSPAASGVSKTLPPPLARTASTPSTGAAKAVAPSLDRAKSTTLPAAASKPAVSAWSKLKGALSFGTTPKKSPATDAKQAKVAAKANRTPEQKAADKVANEKLMAEQKKAKEDKLAATQAANKKRVEEQKAAQKTKQEARKTNREALGKKDTLDDSSVVRAQTHDDILKSSGASTTPKAQKEEAKLDASRTRTPEERDASLQKQAKLEADQKAAKQDKKDAKVQRKADAEAAKTPEQRKAEQDKVDALKNTPEAKAKREERAKKKQEAGTDKKARKKQDDVLEETKELRSQAHDDSRPAAKGKDEPEVTTDAPPPPRPSLTAAVAGSSVSAAGLDAGLALATLGSQTMITMDQGRAQAGGLTKAVSSQPAVQQEIQPTPAAVTSTPSAPVPNAGPPASSGTTTSEVTEIGVSDDSVYTSDGIKVVRIKDANGELKEIAVSGDAGSFTVKLPKGAALLSRPTTDAPAAEQPASTEQKQKTVPEESKKGGEEAAPAKEKTTTDVAKDKLAEGKEKAAAVADEAMAKAAGLADAAKKQAADAAEAMKASATKTATTIGVTAAAGALGSLLRGDFGGIGNAVAGAGSQAVAATQAGLSDAQKKATEQVTTTQQMITSKVDDAKKTAESTIAAGQLQLDTVKGSAEGAVKAAQAQAEGAVKGAKDQAEGAVHGAQGQVQKELANAQAQAEGAVEPVQGEEEATVGATKKQIDNVQKAAATTVEKSANEAIELAADPLISKQDADDLIEVNSLRKKSGLDPLTYEELLAIKEEYARAEEGEEGEQEVEVAPASTGDAEESEFLADDQPAAFDKAEVTGEVYDEASAQEFGDEVATDVSSVPDDAFGAASPGLGNTNEDAPGISEEVEDGISF